MTQRYRVLVDYRDRWRRDRRLSQWKSFSDDLRARKWFLRYLRKMQTRRSWPVTAEIIREADMQVWSLTIDLTPGAEFIAEEALLEPSRRVTTGAVTRSREIYRHRVHRPYEGPRVRSGSRFDLMDWGIISDARSA